MYSDEAFSDYLGKLRKERRVSLGVLAQQAGIHKSTLSRWESGTSVPRVPEMTRVLDSLQASAEVRAKALRLLDVPRVLVAERAASLAPMRLSLGDLLFGLRQRAGLTQVEAARKAGVAQSLYSRWESDGARPDASQIHAVCFALGATGEEAATLSSRELDDTPVAQDREALMARFDRTLPWDDGMTATSFRMMCLAFLANFGRLYRMGKADVGDIALVIKTFGDNASDWGEDKRSARAYYRRARTLAERSHEPLHRLMVPAIAEVSKGMPTVPLTVLQSWLPRFPDDAGRAYMLSFMAKAMAKEAPDEAMRLADVYCALVSDNADEYPCRLRDRGRLLRLCGRPAESVAYLSAWKAQDDFREALRQLDIVQGLVELGSRAEAATCLASAKKSLLPLAVYTLPSEVAQLERLLN